MDKQIDLEALRARLAQMSRAEARELAIKAGLKCSTVEKFRLGHIKEPRLSKLEKIRAALGKSKVAVRTPEVNPGQRASDKSHELNNKA